MNAEDRWTGLPLELQLRILQKIPSQQQWGLRLVSKHFCHAMNILRNKSISGTLSNDSLHLLTNCSFVRTGRLWVKDLTIDLKLYSSTRCTIPYTNYLIIGNGISQENILRLLVHYCHRVNKLTLRPNCFSKLSPQEMKYKYLNGMNHVKCLSIKTWPKYLSTRGPDKYFARQTYKPATDAVINDLRNHCSVMKHFLNKTFANVQTIKLKMYWARSRSDRWPRIQNENLYDHNMAAARQIRTSWNENIHTFFKKNGKNIKNLKICVAQENLEILKYLTLLTNLETLKITLPHGGWNHNSNLNEKSLVSEYLTSAYPSLVNLKQVTLRFNNYLIFDQVYLNLFKSNGSTLESFYLKPSLTLGRDTAFLTSNQYPNLKSLDIRLVFDVIKYETPKNLYQLTSLKTLKLSYYAKHHQFYDEEVIEFISDIASNLAEIELSLDNPPDHGGISLDNIKKLLFGFKDSLERLSMVYNYKNWPYHLNERILKLKQFCDETSNYTFARSYYTKSAAKYCYIRDLKIYCQTNCH